MRQSTRAARWTLSAILLGVGTVPLFALRAHAGEPVRNAERKFTQASKPEPVNSTRRLEAEIEEFPARSTRTSEPATRIPEVVEEPVAPTSVPPRPRVAARVARIDPSEVQHVLGRDAKLIALDTLDLAHVTLLQQRLRERGLYLGRIDGVAGPQTRAALRALLVEQFRLSQLLLQQGQLTSELGDLVGISSGPSATTPPSP